MAINLGKNPNKGGIPPRLRRSNMDEALNIFPEEDITLGKIELRLLEENINKDIIDKEEKI